MNKPVIGVTVSEIRRKEEAQHVRHGEPTMTEMTLGVSYMRAVELTGAIPLAVPPLAIENIDPLLDHVSGLLLTGGPDLDPACYDAEPHPELGPIDPAVDGFELALCRRADARGIPILGICRGAQLLNVARRGTLHQHIPDLPGGGIEHRQQAGGDRTTHKVDVLPDSRLAVATGGGPIPVNSFHHQAIDTLGQGLRPVAWSPDGLIEAIESDNGTFALGVQWHAETLLEQAEQLALFALLAANARRLRLAPSRRVSRARAA